MTSAEPISVYFDTSALAKRYLVEVGSPSVDDFIDGADDALVVTPLANVELESVLKRLMRTRAINAAHAQLAQRQYAADLAMGLWQLRPFIATSFARAAALVRELDVPVNTLDALHLACAIDHRCAAFATADKQLARAATACGLTVHSFA